MTYLFETYGCQMNKAESAALEAALARRGWKRAAETETADLVIINTCSVRITAENRAWGRIAHFSARKKSSSFTLMVTGCMAERLKETLQAEAPGVDYVLGNFQKASFESLLDSIERGQSPAKAEETPAFVFAPSHFEPGAYSSFVPIMHGCDNFCSYCVVPYVRGREISRSPESVMEEIAKAGAAGVREITLIGQNVNSYRWGQDGALVDFAALLRAAAPAAEASGVGRIRFLSSHPKDLSDRIIDAIADHALISRHVHLCVQHGSDRVLAAMNRGYTVEYYRSLVDRMRSRVPGLTVSTDILVGFPGETEEDVELTLELMRDVRFAYSYMYHYNRREGTMAATLPDQVPSELRKQRLARVIRLQKEISAQVMSDMVGSESLALVEGVSSRKPDELIARTDQDFMAAFKASPDLIGRFVRIALTGIRGTTFRAEALG